MTSWAAVLLSAQTITSVQDGPWNDPATWDCLCVPPGPTDVLVAHQVDFTGTQYMANTLTVLPGAELSQAGSGNVVAQFLDVQGTMTSTGWMVTYGQTTVSGTLSAVSFYAGAGLTLQGGTVLITSNFSQGAGQTVDGTGSMCIGDSTNIQGPMVGSIDVCDLTPTTTVPPFVDVGAIYVASSITFCQGSVCSTSLPEAREPSALSVTPNPARTWAHINGLKGPANAVLLVDLAGRTVPMGWREVANGIELGLDAVVPGAYVVRVADASGVRVVRMWKD